MEEEEESQFSDALSMSQQMDTDFETNEESEGVEESEGDVSGQKSAEEGVEASRHIDQHWCAHNWESLMEESEGLAFDEPCSGSDTTVTWVDSPLAPSSSPHDKSGGSQSFKSSGFLLTMSRGSTPHSQESPIKAGEVPLLTAAATMPASSVDAVGVQVSQSELDDL